MSEHILIGIAWPYANGPLHLGHIAGAYLPADIFARYHRLKGNEVLMVSGSDQHGAPITIRAAEESTSPEEIANRYDQQFRDCWQKLGISFDLFTTTSTVNHTEVTHDIFLTLLRKGYIYRDTMLQAYCSRCQRFLPDRYLEGTCPHCGFDKARGDQCEVCGRPVNPFDLKDLRCYLCSATPQFRSSEHFFLRLSAFQKQLEEWMSGQTCWRRNVLGATWKFLDEGLKDRAITRDLDWGISVPQDGFDDKRIYVWFEAVIGYLSASKEWARLRGDESAWQPFWRGEGKSFYFVGKDNIFFHTLVWPAMLLGYGDLNLPYNVPGNEFLTIEGQKLSTSRKWAVWLPDYLERYQPDPLRYILSVNMPETSDSDFSWREFLRRNNNELVATYGNLVHRVLTFTYRNFDRAVPAPGDLDARSQELMQRATTVMRTVDELIYGCNFKEAINEAMSLAREANQYLDEQSPWKKIKEERQASARSIYTALSLLSALKIVLYPFLPFSSEKLHSLLGFDGSLREVGWEFQLPEPGQKLPEPYPLFAKLDDSIVDEENSRLGIVSGE
ncbi:MAG: methionine--tRNA ligase [Dehalococcoidia bacterium]|nr:methionine--tRNA ligase [Dehalococcoidia bacterium]